MKKKIMFVINPISGTGRKASLPAEIEKYLDHEVYDAEIRYTERAGHAAELTKEAAEAGVDVVVAVGGDGTVNEVARALVHTSTALGIIPCGSGNGLARHLQIPQNVKRAIEIINANMVHCLDYCKINDHPFFCTCGMGFDAFVSAKFAESGNRGLLQYAKSTIQSGLSYKPQRYRIEHEDGSVEEVEAFLIACANASQYGNNAFIAPTASMKDGLMDVIVLEPFNTLLGPQVVVQMFMKTLLYNNHVRMFKCRRVRIVREEAGPVHCDGDPLEMGRDICIELVRQNFNVVVNPAARSNRKTYIQEFAEWGEELIASAQQIVETDETPTLKNPIPIVKNLVDAIRTKSDADPFDLKRFVVMHERYYLTALAEVKAGRKQSHWMWYIFPQLQGLGQSATSQKYGITGADEAYAYLMHPLLGAHLHEISDMLMAIEGSDAVRVFGEIDARKLRSCMTLFANVAPNCEIFEEVIQKYFGGNHCALTLQKLSEAALANDNSEKL